MARMLIAALLIVMMIPLAGCNFQIANDDIVQENMPDIATPEGAREKLSQLNVSYNVDEFVNRATECDLVAVKLFLTAGMNPNAKNKDGITAFEAATDAGHEEIAALLKDAVTGKKESSDDSEKSESS